MSITAIELVRRERNMRRTELAVLAGVSVAHLSRIERHERRCSPRLLRALADALGVDVRLLDVDVRLLLGLWTRVDRS